MRYEEPGEEENRSIGKSVSTLRKWPLLRDLRQAQDKMPINWKEKEEEENGQSKSAHSGEVSVLFLFYIDLLFLDLTAQFLSTIAQFFKGVI